MKAIIPCAGRSDRFNNQCKALVNLNGQTVVERIVKQISLYVNSITVISDSQHKNQFYEKFDTNNRVSIILDDSYSGTGGVIEKALANFSNKDTILIVWGDTVYKSEKFIGDFIKEYYKCQKYELYIAAQFEKNPYLAVLLDDNVIPNNIFFSKEEGYRLPSGYHDLSTFIIKRGILRYLKQVKPILNGEKRFLDLVNVLYKKGDKIKLCKFSHAPVLSFNTPNELKMILKFFKLE